MKFNETLTGKKNFRNPALLPDLIARFEIDPVGTMFPPSVWNPRDASEGRWTAHPDDFFDAMAADLKKIEALREAEMHKRTSIEFVNPASAAAAAVGLSVSGGAVPPAKRQKQ